MAANPNTKAILEVALEISRRRPGIWGVVLPIGEERHIQGWPVAHNRIAAAAVLVAQGSKAPTPALDARYHWSFGLFGRTCELEHHSGAGQALLTDVCA